MAVTKEQWNLVETYFDALADQAPDARAASLAAIPDEHIRREVASLLHHTQGANPFAAAVGAVAEQIDSEGFSQNPQGRRLGAYKLVRRLGQGGQGAVFEAARDDGTFQQRVAIKIVKWDVDTDSARTQFRQERQLLAGLEHPNIARLLDGGETADGTPYLVMEYVDGLPLIPATAGWPLRKKLELFLHVSSAVAFAHRNLIVHRDLKPANILVTQDGVPKLLDFGIAKLIDTSAQRTLTGFQALTPQYASPEQVRGEPVTTASDVYSLGVVLYELLTARRPYEVRTTSPAEIHRAVCIAEIAPANISADIDNILFKAMHKDPARRYASVEQFAQDIERSLTGHPVLARPDTLRYRAGKFIGRNRYAIAGIAIAMAGLITTTAIAVQQALKSQHLLQDVRHQANSFMFDVDEKLENSTGLTTAREQVGLTTLRYLEQLTAEVGEDQELAADLTASYEKVADLQRLSLGKLDECRRGYMLAIQTGEKLLSRGHAPDRAIQAVAKAYLGMAYFDSRHFKRQEALEFDRKAVSLAASYKQADWSRAVRVSGMVQIARFEVEEGNLTKTLQVCSDGLSEVVEEEKLRPSDILWEAKVDFHRTAAAALKDRGDLDAAQNETNIAMALLRSRGDPPPARYLTRYVFGLGGPGTGMGTVRPLELYQELVPPTARRGLALVLDAQRKDSSNASLKNILGNAYIAASVVDRNTDYARALHDSQEAVRILGELMASDPSSNSSRSNLATGLTNLGSAMMSAQDWKGALVPLRRSVEIAKTVSTPGDPDAHLIDALLHLGVAETNAGQLEPSRAHLSQSLAESLSLWPKHREGLFSFAYIGLSYEALGDLELKGGNRKAACEDFRKALKTWTDWGSSGVSSYYDRGHIKQLQRKISARFCALPNESVFQRSPH